MSRPSTVARNTPTQRTDVAHSTECPSLKLAKRTLSAQSQGVTSPHASHTAAGCRGHRPEPRTGSRSPVLCPVAACRLPPGRRGQGCRPHSRGCPGNCCCTTNAQMRRLKAPFIFISNLLPGEADLCRSPQNKVRGRAFSAPASASPSFQESHGLRDRPQRLCPEALCPGSALTLSCQWFVRLSLRELLPL